MPASEQTMEQLIGENIYTEYQAADKNRCMYVRYQTGKGCTLKISMRNK